ncbi:conserved hypothetical protein [Candidatus Phytoplasma mali]|uniref:Uncharacterized protein n=1 Tax=Phytoplasma mali (strain AT) TaxID=482235 RepID=B3R0A7_PHYMT|nr:hypothetical protein [Candidatus Phytoplasma mali]CAP18271.1 conserved hypothetical protein [Candidatus Phytoplasma mali]
MFLKKSLYNKKTPKMKITLILNYLIICIIGMFQGIKQGIRDKRNFFSIGLFTRQNSIILNIFLSLCLNKKFQNSKYYLYSSFILLINNLIIFFICFWETKKPHCYLLEHKIIPLMFILFYFYFNKKIINLNHSYIGLIYPFFYLAIIMLLGTYDKNYYPYKMFNDFAFFSQDHFIILRIFLSLVMILLSLWLIIILKKSTQKKT